MNLPVARRFETVGRLGTADVSDPRPLQTLFAVLGLAEWCAWALSDGVSMSSGVVAGVVAAVTVVAWLLPWERWFARVGPWAVAWLGVVDVVLIGAMFVTVPQSICVVLLGGPALWLGRVGPRGIALCAASAVLGVMVPVLIADGLSAGSLVRGFLPAAIAVVASTAKAAAVERDAYERSVEEAMVETVGVGLQLVDGQGRTIRRNGVVPLLAGDEPVGLLGREDRLSPDQMPVARAARGEAYDELLIWVGVDPRKVYSVSSRQVLDACGSTVAATLAWQEVTAIAAGLESGRTLLASISHDIRSPLTAILGHLEMLEHQNFSLREQSMLTTIENSSHRILRLVSDLLLETERERSDLNLARAPTNLALLVRDAVTALNPAALHKQIDLALHAPPVVEAEVDAARFTQAVDNLVSNAVKYTEPGGTVRVTVAREPDATVLTVSDTGIGIGAEDIPRIFDDYFRADHARQRNAPGTGLGLGIVRKIVALHGGTAEVTSRLGEGTTVTVRVPH